MIDDHYDKDILALNRERLIQRQEMKSCDHKKYYTSAESGVPTEIRAGSAFEPDELGRHKCSRCGSQVTENVTEYVNGIPAEIEFYDENHNQIGFWAYGQYHPDYPFQGS